MGIFGEVVIPIGNLTNYTMKQIRDTNSYDIFLNYFFAVHSILAIILGLTLAPLIIYFHLQQRKSVATILFLVINLLDLVRSIYNPLILLPKLVSRDIGPFWDHYTGWVGHVNNALPVITEIEFILLVALCTVRYWGVTRPHKSLNVIVMVTVILVVARILMFVGVTVGKYLHRPYVKPRMNQLVFTVNENFNLKVLLKITAVKHLLFGLVLIYGIAISALSINYLNTLRKATACSKTSDARNRKSIKIIVIMNVFSVLVALVTLIQAVSLIINSHNRFTTADCFITFSVVHGLPLSQSMFNSLCFVSASSSFRRFLRRYSSKRNSVSNSNASELQKRASMAAKLEEVHPVVVKPIVRGNEQRT
ncbi:hypothetical protein ACHWQZ_G002875 [Mnemiopsis leidyi]